MQLTEKADVVNEAEAQAGAPEEAGQPGDLKGPRLTQEQREWLNTVFIPNFRAELIRTLKPEDLLSSKERRKRRAGRPQPPIDAGKQQAPSPTLPRAGSSEETDASGQADAEASDSDAVEQPAEQSAQRVAELEGETRRLRAALADTRVDRELVWAAASQHAINPAQVAQLLRDRVRLDRSLDPIVVNANGDRAYDAYGRPVTVADAVRTFLEANPHLVRPSTTLAGGGSGGTDATARVRRVAAVTGGDLIEEALREGE